MVCPRLAVLFALLAEAAAKSTLAGGRTPLVLGIDLGDHSCVVATVTGRTGVEVVTNDVSGRTVPRSVGRDLRGMPDARPPYG